MNRQLISKSVGIDLGTTNSAVAVMNQSDSDVLLHRDDRTGAQTTPSCVWKNPRSGEVVVGMGAFRRLGTRPEPVRSIKRRMGQRSTVLLTDEQRSPEEISADILRELRGQIQRDLSGWNTSETTWVVDRGIVTVPAYFDHPSIEATRHAAELAGIEVTDLLHEPTAAAVYHCWQHRIDDGVFLVYDLGGGTFDVSVVRCTAGSFEVLGISGDNGLGGDNIDDAIAQHLRRQLVEEGYALELDLRRDPEDRIRFNQLRFLAEGVKKALTRQTDYLLSDQSTLRDKEGNLVAISTMWERGQLDEIMQPIVARTLPLCLQAVELAGKKAGIGLADVDQVILAGGSTHIPLVRDMVAATLCRPGPDGAGQSRAKCAEPVYEKVDTIVALGAAIRAASVGGLTVHDPARSVRIAFKGIGATGSTVARAGGTVTALDPAVDLAGGEVRLTAGDHEEYTGIGSAGLFSFKDIPVQPETGNPMRFEVFDGAGALVAVADRPVHHGAEHGRIPPQGAPTRLAKAFRLEVLKDGKAHLKELVPALADLPVSEDYTFLHPGGTDTVVFSMYQMRRRIQELRVPVPASTPSGVPIKLNVTIDELSFITVRGCIGDVEFGVPVVPPADRPIPSQQELRDLTRKFEEATQYLAPGPRAVLASKWRQAQPLYEAAVELADDGQIVHAFEALEALVEEGGRETSTLEPAREVFDQLVETCRQLNAYLAGRPADESRPHDQAEVGRSVDALRRQGDAAFTGANQRAYGEAVQMLEHIRANLVALYRESTDGADNRTDAERVEQEITETRKLAVVVQTLAGARQKAEIKTEAAALDLELDDLGRRVHQETRTVQARAGQVRARLGQLHNILTGRDSNHAGDLPVEIGSGR